MKKRLISRSSYWEPFNWSANTDAQQRMPLRGLYRVPVAQRYAVAYEI